MFKIINHFRNYFTTLLLLALCSNSSMAHINLIDPNGGETYVPGEVITISWEVEQIHVGIDIDLYYSSDGGENWEKIASLNLDQFEYKWRVPIIETEQGKIRVIQDNEGLDYIDISSNFRIAGIVTAVEDSKDPVPSEFLYNYPNPFHSETTIEFTLAQYGHVSLEIYSIQGIKIATLRDEMLPAGTYSTPWDAGETKPGLYMGLVRAGTFTESRKLIRLE